MRGIRLDSQEYESVKKSFKNLYAFFIEHQYTSKDFLHCIQKWGYQLTLQREEYLFPENYKEVNFELPDNRLDALEQVYDVVYMIYLDQEIEDVELEITTLFAKALGFPGYIVGDLLKAIVTAPYDGMNKTEVRKELELIIKEEKD
ncbi:MAG: hypothetical protein M3512_09525 [Bacteroidota bacterium]|nr:hypothetical protein [Bacteroidota bacterium]